MSQNEHASNWVKSVAAKHLGANIRRFKWSTWTACVRHNSLGGVTMLSPIEGKVVECGDEYTLIKTGPSDFCVVITDLLDAPVSVGDKIACKFYELRRFDGKLSSGFEDRDGSGITSFSLTGARTLFPAKWADRYLQETKTIITDTWTTVQNRYLRDLITQLEAFPTGDGYRKGVDVLVSANADNLRFIDPPEHLSAGPEPTVWPSIVCQVTTKKFAGEVAIRYDRGADTYALFLTDALSGEAAVLDDVHFDELVPTLLDRIDDGSWKQVRVTMVMKAPKARVAKGQGELLAA